MTTYGIENIHFLFPWEVEAPPPEPDPPVPPALRAQTNYQGAVTETSSVVLLPTIANGAVADWQPGDVVYIGWDLTAATGVTTTPPGWTTVVPGFNSSSSTSAVHGVIRRVMQTGDSNSVTISHTNGRFAALTSAWVGADNVAPEDVVPTTDNNASVVYPNVRAPAISTVRDGCAILSFHAARNSTNGATTTFEPDVSETEINEATSNVAAVSNAAIEAAYFVQTTAGATSALTATATSSSGTLINQMGSTIAIRPARLPAEAPVFLDIIPRTPRITEAAAQGAGAPFTALRPIDQAVGDLVVAWFGFSDTAVNSTGPGGDWVLVPGSQIAPAAGRNARAYYQFNPSSDPVVSQVAAGRITAVVQSYGNVDPSNPMDIVAAVSATAAGTPLVIPPIEPITPGARVVSFATIDAASGTWTVPTQQTLVGSNTSGVGRGLAVADEEFSIPGSTGTRTFVFSAGSLAMAGASFTLRPAEA